MFSKRNYCTRRRCHLTCFLNKRRTCDALVAVAGWNTGCVGAVLECRQLVQVSKSWSQEVASVAPSIFCHTRQQGPEGSRNRASAVPDRVDARRFGHEGDLKKCASRCGLELI